ncbi:GL10265 [Drosophila persimilis]|uniref:GL10265 n=1 Tax=Drosophila persimilis TaxID=7234 RepID=B4HCN4_DROPE|nr:GL10265 [Drosophila persimilis]
MYRRHKSPQHANINLADQNFYQSQPVDILIGAARYIYTDRDRKNKFRRLEQWPCLHSISNRNKNDG